MTASERPPRDPTDIRLDDQPTSLDGPFWTDNRRAVFWDVVRRFGCAVLLALLAAGWASLAILWLINLALIGEGEPAGVVWLAVLLPGIGHFALSVVRLVEPRAPAALRVLGVIYAILGMVAILSLLEFV